MAVALAKDGTRQFDLARNGQADLAVGQTSAKPGRYPMTELSSLPFV